MCEGISGVAGGGRISMRSGGFSTSHATRQTATAQIEMQEPAAGDSSFVGMAPWHPAHHSMQPNSWEFGLSRQTLTSSAAQSIACQQAPAIGQSQTVAPPARRFPDGAKAKAAPRRERPLRWTRRDASEAVLDRELSLGTRQRKNRAVAIDRIRRS